MLQGDLQTSPPLAATVELGCPLQQRGGALVVVLYVQNRRLHLQNEAGADLRIEVRVIPKRLRRPQLVLV